MCRSIFRFSAQIVWNNYKKKLTEDLHVCCDSVYIFFSTKQIRVLAKSKEEKEKTCSSAYTFGYILYFP